MAQFSGQIVRRHDLTSSPLYNLLRRCTTTVNVPARLLHHNNASYYSSRDESIIRSAIAAVQQLATAPKSASRLKVWGSAGDHSSNSAEPTRNAADTRLEYQLEARYRAAFGSWWDGSTSSRLPAHVQPELWQRLEVGPVYSRVLFVLSQLSAGKVEHALYVLKALPFVLKTLYEHASQLHRDGRGGDTAQLQPLVEQLGQLVAFTEQLGLLSREGSYTGSFNLPFSDFPEVRDSVVARWVGLLGRVGQYGQAKAFLHRLADQGRPPELNELRALMCAALDSGEYGEATLVLLSAPSFGLPLAEQSELRSLMVEVAFEAARAGQATAVVALLNSAKEPGRVDTGGSLLPPWEPSRAEAASPRGGTTSETYGGRALHVLTRAMISHPGMDPATEPIEPIGADNVEEVASALSDDLSSALQIAALLGQADPQGRIFNDLWAMQVRVAALRSMMRRDAVGLARTLKGGHEAVKRVFEARMQAMSGTLSGQNRAPGTIRGTKSRSNRDRGLGSDRERLEAEAAAADVTQAAVSIEAAAAQHASMSSDVCDVARWTVEQVLLSSAGAFEVNGVGPGSADAAMEAIAHRSVAMLATLKDLGVWPDSSVVAEVLRLLIRTRQPDLVQTVLADNTLTPMGTELMLQYVLLLAKQPTAIASLLQALPALVAAGVRPDPSTVRVILNHSGRLWMAGQTVACPKCGAEQVQHTHVDEDGKLVSTIAVPAPMTRSALSRAQSALSSSGVGVRGTLLGDGARGQVEAGSHRATMRMMSTAAASEGAPAGSEAQLAGSISSGNRAVDSTGIAGAVSTPAAEPPSSASLPFSYEADEHDYEEVPIVKGRAGRAGKGQRQRLSPLSAGQKVLRALELVGAASTASRSTLPTGMGSQGPVDHTVRCFGAVEHNPRLAQEWPLYPSQTLAILSRLGLLADKDGQVHEQVAFGLHDLAGFSAKAGCARETSAVWSVMQSLGVVPMQSKPGLLRNILRTMVSGGLSLPAWQLYTLVYPKRTGPLPNLAAIAAQMDGEDAAKEAALARHAEERHARFAAAKAEETAQAEAKARAVRAKARPVGEDGPASDIASSIGIAVSDSTTTDTVAAERLTGPQEEPAPALTVGQEAALAVGLASAAGGLPGRHSDGSKRGAWLDMKEERGVRRPREPREFSPRSRVSSAAAGPTDASTNNGTAAEQLALIKQLMGLLEAEKARSKTMEGLLHTEMARNQAVESQVKEIREQMASIAALVQRTPAPQAPAATSPAASAVAQRQRPTQPAAVAAQAATTQAVPVAASSTAAATASAPAAQAAAPVETAVATPAPAAAPAPAPAPASLGPILPRLLSTVRAKDTAVWSAVLAPRKGGAVSLQPILAAVVPKELAGSDEKAVRWQAALARVLTLLCQSSPDPVVQACVCIVRDGCFHDTGRVEQLPSGEQGAVLAVHLSCQPEGMPAMPADSTDAAVAYQAVVRQQSAAIAGHFDAARAFLLSHPSVPVALRAASIQHLKVGMPPSVAQRLLGDISTARDGLTVHLMPPSPGLRTAPLKDRLQAMEAALQENQANVRRGAESNASGRARAAAAATAPTAEAVAPADSGAAGGKAASNAEISATPTIVRPSDPFLWSSVSLRGGGGAVQVEPTVLVSVPRRHAATDTWFTGWPRALTRLLTTLLRASGHEALSATSFSPYDTCIQPLPEPYRDSVGQHGHPTYALHVTVPLEAKYRPTSPAGTDAMLRDYQEAVRQEERHLKRVAKLARTTLLEFVTADGRLVVPLDDKLLVLPEANEAADRLKTAVKAIGELPKDKVVEVKVLGPHVLRARVLAHTGLPEEARPMEALFHKGLARREALLAKHTAGVIMKNKGQGKETERMQ